MDRYARVATRLRVFSPASPAPIGLIPETPNFIDRLLGVSMQY